MANNSKKWALGTVLAAVGGYITGILTAPKSGKETRQDIKDEAVKVKVEAEKKLKELHTELDVVIGEGHKKADELKTVAKSALATAETAKTKVRELLSRIHSGEADSSELGAAIKEATKALENLKKHINEIAKTTKK